MAKKSPKGGASKASPTKPAAEPIALPTAPPPGLTEITVKLDDILVDRDHVGERLVDDTEIRHLAASMAQHGQLAPVGVQPADAQGVHRLIWGRRRVEAARILKWEHITAVTFSRALTPGEVQEARAAENLDRINLNPAEEALAVTRLVEMYENDALDDDRDGTKFPTHTDPARNAEMTPAAKAALRSLAVQKASERLAKPAQWVRDRLFLARLDGAARTLVMTGELPLAHAREISKLADPALRSDLAKRAASDKRSGLPMRLDHVKEEVRRNLLSLGQVPWKLDVAFAGKPACVECPHNSANTPGLFGDHVEFSADRQRARLTGCGTKGQEPAAGVCTLASCFAEKSNAANAKVRSARDKAVRAIQAAGKKAPAPSASFVQQFTPEFISPATVASMAKEALKAPKKKAGASRAQTSEAEKAREQRWQDENEARTLVRKAHATWLKTWEPKVSQALNAKPGRWALLQLIRCTKAFQGTEAFPDKKARAAAEAPALKRLLNLLVAPTWESMLAVQKECGTKYGTINDAHDLDSGVALHIAKAVGVDADPILTEEEALAQVIAKRTAAKTEPKKDAGKKAGKGGGKGRAKKGTVDEAGEQWNGFAGDDDEDMDG